MLIWLLLLTLWWGGKKNKKTKLVQCPNLEGCCYLTQECQRKVKRQILSTECVKISS